MAAPILPCTEASQIEKAAARAAELLRRGGLVVFPTETVYGVAADVSSPRGLERLREVKSRTDDKPFTLHLADPQQVSRYVDLESPPLIGRLVRKAMPGPITIVADASAERIAAALKAAGLAPDASDRLYHRGTIGLRCPDDPVAEAVLSACGAPVVASSANPAGGREPHDARAAAEALGDQVDLILDGGTSPCEKPSTVVRVHEDRAVVLREGVYTQEDIDRFVRWMWLFVCTGNTCRSPMAQAIAAHELAERLGVAVDDLESHGVGVYSAGAFAMPGSSMTAQAAAALRELGVSVPDHESTPLLPEMIDMADAVFCMTRSHEAAVLSIAPHARDRIHLLDADGQDVSDPIGGDGGVYLQCARQLQDLVRRRLDEMEPPVPALRRS